MKTWSFTVELPINVTETDIEDIITTAVEGGINYWGSVVKEGKSDKPISPRKPLSAAGKSLSLTTTVSCTSLHLRSSCTELRSGSTAA